jgi:hypothetical protein
MSRLAIVCPPDFSQVCQSYAEFKRKTGLTCDVVPFDSSQKQAELANAPFLSTYGISPARLSDPATCLKVELLRRYLAMGTRFVLLAGDANKLPVAWFEFVQSGKRFFYPTDLFYADLLKPGAPSPSSAFQTWDPDRDTVKGEFRSDQVAPIDFYPDLAIGRIPASSASELGVALQRLMNRPARPPRAILLRGNDPGGNTTWLDQIMTQAEGLLHERGYGVVAKLSIAADASPAAAQGVLDQFHAAIQGGAEYVFWFGHGGTGGWGEFGPYLLDFSTEVPKFNASPVVFSMSCNVGAYVGHVYDGPYLSGGAAVNPGATPGQVPPVPDALQPMDADFAPEEWLVKHSRGAATLIAGHSWGSLGSDFLGTQPLDFVRALPPLTGLPTTVGSAYNAMLVRYLAKYKQNLPNDATALNHLLRIHLFGDPTTPLF